MAQNPDVVVVGGGLVGLAIAYGLVRQKLRAVVCDEGDRAFRASRGNFGLVWVQGKGVDSAPYARLTSHSARLWPDYAQRLQRDSGIDPGHVGQGGLSLYLDDNELAQKSAAMAALKSHTPDFSYQVLDAAGVRRYLPSVSPRIAARGARASRVACSAGARRAIGSAKWIGTSAMRSNAAPDAGCAR